MIKGRMQKAQRVLKAQRDLQRIEEGKVAALRSRQAELSALQEEMLGALSKEDGLQGLYIDATVRRLKKVSEEGARLAEELERRSAALLVHAGRAKCAERRSRAYEQEHARASAQKELLDVIERFIQPKDASLP